ncbi:MAG TPA: asparagine synthase-related protein [Pyrinomonadaceae bacterium]|jgi:asparagine synthase (glutamine-hydrolysing)|nr:asparagine synthase-related protein [Pyrinomonadaceae bacterium]
MSALAGILNLNGAPVDPRLLAEFGRRLANQGPDGGGQRQTGTIGIVFRANHADRESKLERQPLVSTNGHILTWDGRLDNRSALITQLRDYVDRSATDVEIVMASYSKWPTDFVARLIGDFALSLWDPATRTLLLARDAFGTRPIYYHANPQRIVWSSDLGSILDLGWLATEVDREYVASFLNSSPDLELTAYKNIHAVPPGFVLLVRDGHIEKREFWRPSIEPEIRYRSDSEYEDHFRELFREAVRCRLRSDAPVWAELSGGLDSSSIVCMADQIIASGEAESTQLETVSYVYDNSAASDERKFIGEVEASRARAGHHFHEDESVGRFLDLNFDSIVRANPTYRFIARHDWVRAQMQQTGSKVLLSGVAGDNLLWSSAEVSPELADLLVQMRLPSLHRQLRRWSRATRTSYAGTLWRRAILPSLPARFTSPSAASTLMHPQFAKQIELVERSTHESDVRDVELPSARVQARMLSSAIRAVASCYYRDRVATEYRFPFLHRPLVEFLLAIPIEQKLRPGESRSLQRRALKHVLPTAILTRRGKRWSNEALCRTLANNWREVEWLFREPRVCEYGFVDARAFAETAKRIQHGLQSVNGELVGVLSVELWLRALESRKSSVLHDVKLAS